MSDARWSLTRVAVGAASTLQRYFGCPSLPLPSCRPRHSAKSLYYPRNAGAVLLQFLPQCLPGPESFVFPAFSSPSSLLPQGRGRVALGDLCKIAAHLFIYLFLQLFAVRRPACFSFKSNQNADATVGFRLLMSFSYCCWHCGAVRGEEEGSAENEDEGAGVLPAAAPGLEHRHGPRARQ